MSGIKINKMRGRRRRRSVDFSQLREQLRGMPTNYISYGTVGHTTVTPMYARIENGQVYVEVTLAPSGDEIVARLDTGGGSDSSGFYMPLAYGSRVVVALPGGTGTEAVIIGRVNDSTWPFPTEASSVPIYTDTPSPGSPAPMFAFLRTQDGHLLAIESGDGGDIVIHSGASVEIRTNSGEQILLNGRTHIGESFSTPPVGALVSAGGEVTTGTQGAAHVPVPVSPLFSYAPGAPLVIDPTTPADGIVRAKDTIQSDASVDPTWWAAWSAICGFCGIAVPPTSLGSTHRSASKHTASDD